MQHMDILYHGIGLTVASAFLSGDLLSQLLPPLQLPPLQLLCPIKRANLCQSLLNEMKLDDYLLEIDISTSYHKIKHTRDIGVISI